MIGESVLIAWQLLVRDIKVFRPQFFSELLNLGIYFTVAYINFAILGPHIGITPLFAAQALVGILVGGLILLAFGRADSDISDLTFSRFITYWKLLPISSTWLMLVYVASYMLYIAVCVLPLIIYFMILFAKFIVPLTFFHVLLFFIFFIGSLLLVATSLLNFVFYFSYNWFNSNLWDRILTPVSLFGCQMYPWKKVYEFSPKLAYVLLLNPYVYITEGLRSHLLGDPVNYFPFSICCCAVWVLGCIGLLVFKRVFEQRLDHV